MTRSRMIQERSGKEFDNIYGPIAVCLALIIALCLNLGIRVSSLDIMAFSEANTLQYHAVLHKSGGKHQTAMFHQNALIEMSQQTAELVI